MSYKRLLTERVDIFHLKEKECTYGYGIESISGADKEYYYDQVPDYIDIPCYCYFVSGSNNKNTTQNDVNSKVFEVLKINFLNNVDVRMNSKILFDNEFYILQKSRKVRNHHIEVVAIREEYL